LLASGDGQTLIDADTKQIGYTAANIVGVLTGSVVGNVDGNAANASKLNDISPSIAVPGSVDKTSIPVRDGSGYIYATQFVGVADTADRLRINDSAVDTDPDYRSAKVNPIANSIAARNGSGSLLAYLFEGTATSARYADLAEKYLADQEYPVGTVVSVGGEKEVTAAKLGERALGVVSENPAFMMNKDLDGGTYIALKGRVPVFVIGSIRKGDRLVSTDTGHAIRSTHHTHVDAFAIALATDDRTELRLVEAAIL
jgi:hypothetical protein